MKWSRFLGLSFIVFFLLGTSYYVLQGPKNVRNPAAKLASYSAIEVASSAAAAAQVASPSLAASPSTPLAYPTAVPSLVSPPAPSSATRTPTSFPNSLFSWIESSRRAAPGSSPIATGTPYDSAAAAAAAAGAGAAADAAVNVPTYNVVSEPTIIETRVASSAVANPAPSASAASSAAATAATAAAAPAVPASATTAAPAATTAAPGEYFPSPLPPLPTPPATQRSEAIESQIKTLGVPLTPSYPPGFVPPEGSGLIPAPADWVQRRQKADPFPAFFPPAPTPRATPAPGSPAAYAVRATTPGAAGAKAFDPLPPAPTPANAEVARMRAAVVAEAKHAWDGYASLCFGQDEVIPGTKKCKNWMGAALQIIDALSTLHLMGLKEEYKAGRDWVANNLRFDKYHPQVSFFETTIRIVGGLLSAYDMTGDIMLLDKCVDVGNRLTMAWQNPALPLPSSLVSLITGSNSLHSWSSSLILSEIGTVQMEYFTLSALSGDPSFHSLADAVVTALRDSKLSTPGLYPLNIAYQAPLRYTTSQVTLGGLSDSYYEYLLKMWILSGRTNDRYRDMYAESADALVRHLFVEVAGIGFVAEHPARGSPGHMEHLSCFSGGMFALGLYSNAITDPAARARQLYAAKKITEGCVLSYLAMGSGVGPESFTVNNKTGVVPRESVYHLRPEAIESVFYLWRLTKEQKYRDWGWKMFENVRAACRHDVGYVGLSNVQTGTKSSSMETFLLAETLKYFFLLFSDDNALDLDTWVFNTEAHPVRSRPWVMAEDPKAFIEANKARRGNVEYKGPHTFTFPPLR